MECEGKKNNGMASRFNNGCGPRQIFGPVSFIQAMEHDDNIAGFFHASWHHHMVSEIIILLNFFINF